MVAMSPFMLQGYNATVLAYGQTGSGKTHTMSGGQGIHGVVEEGEMIRQRQGQIFPKYPLNLQQDLQIQ